MRFTAVLMILPLAACGKADYCADTDAAKINAFVWSQSVVEKRLKSPGAANFPKINAPGVSVSRTAPCEFYVRGFVDAQNGFGAVLRSTYSMMFIVSGDQKSYTTRDVKIVTP